VRYPDKLVSDMRRLSRGAKVTARVIRASDGQIELHQSEVNGVAVTFSHLDIAVRKVNRFSGFISHHIMKVPRGYEKRFSRAIAPL